MIVADTNLIAYLYIEGEFTEAAEQILAQEAEWAAPPLWRSELRNVLALYIRRNILTLDEGLGIARTAEDFLAPRSFAVDTEDVLYLAAESGCTAYDCEFVALAQKLEIRLVTNDRKVLSAFPDTACSPEALLDAQSDENGL
ncbi:MAG: PIN domain-containing protein [Candidatus Latescibacteria bacterium]|nr:PIN domain-containing protein [Candidatus Latescibacterota bacterium]